LEACGDAGRTGTQGRIHEQVGENRRKIHSTQPVVHRDNTCWCTQVGERLGATLYTGVRAGEVAMASITNPFAMLEDPSAMGLSKKARKKKKAAVEPAASSTPEVAAPVKVSPRPVPYACATHSPTAAHTLTLASRVGQPTAPPTAPSSLNTKGSPRAKPPRRPRRLDGTVPRTYPPIHQPLTRSTARPKPLQTRHVGATKGLPPPLRCWRGWGGTV
jgi:hypothetical protein